MNRLEERKNFSCAENKSSITIFSRVEKCEINPSSSEPFICVTPLYIAKAMKERYQVLMTAYWNLISCEDIVLFISAINYEKTTVSSTPAILNAVYRYRIRPLIIVYLADKSNGVSMPRFRRYRD